MIMIYGAQDTLVNIVDPHADNDGIDALDKEVSILVGTAAAGVVVRFEYAPRRNPRHGLGDGATWQVRVDLVDTDIPIPWPVRVEAEGYSPRVVIDCPAGTKWRRL